MVRQPVGVRVERRVGQRAVLEHDRDRVRRARRLRGEQRRQASRARPRLRRGVPSPQDGAALGGVQDRRLPSGRVRRPRPPPPAAGPAAAASASTVAALEQVGPVVEPQLQLLARLHDQRQRIVRRVAALHLAEPQPVRLPRQRRRGRPDSSRTPPACRTGRPAPPPAGSRPAPHADAPSAPTARPASAAAAPTAAARGGSCSRSGSVLMNSPTIRSAPASSAGRPATVTPNTTSSRPVSRPSSTPNAVCISVFSVSACSRAEPASERVSAAIERQRRPAPGATGAVPATAAAQAACPPPAPPAPRARPPAPPRGPGRR